MNGENVTSGSTLLKMVSILLIGFMLFSALTIDVSASDISGSKEEQQEFVCTYSDCDGLPLNITDCPICIYENWDDDLKEYAKELAEEKGIKYSIVLSVIYGESRFNKDATNYNTNGTTDRGLMQINNSTYNYLQNEIGLTYLDELYDPRVNILAGIELLEYHKDATNTDAQMVMRYNVGEGNCARLVNNGVYITKYQQKIISIAGVYEDYLS